MSKIYLKIGGMHCAACKASVLKAAASVGAQGDVDVVSGAAVFSGCSDASALCEAIRAAGFSADLAGAVRAEPPLFWQFAPAAAALVLALFCLRADFAQSAVLSAFAVALGAGKFIFRALFRRAFGMDLLISLGIFINYSFSFLFSHDYFFECAFIAFIVAFGKACESAAKRYAIRLLRPIAPPHARLASGQIIPANELKIGDFLRLNPGETLHTDARLLTPASFDLSVSSGESEPVALAAGAEVAAGAVALSGCELEALAAYEQSSLAQLRALALAASSSAPKAYAKIDLAARYFSAAIISLAAAVFALWWARADAGTAAFYASSVLLISCPCALGLAVPMSASCAVALAFARGVVVRDAALLHARPSCIASDKTGTLCQLAVRAQVPQREDFLLLLSAQNFSAHPISAALLALPHGPLPKISGEASLEGFDLIFRGQDAAGRALKIECLHDERGFSVLINGRAAGRVDAASSLVPAACELREFADVIVLSGDSKEAVAAAAAPLNASYAARASAAQKAQIIRALRCGKAALGEFGIDCASAAGEEFFARLAKLPKVNKLQSKEVIFYLGDGANDLGCLRAADFTIAMASSHAALSSKAAAVAPSIKSAVALLKIGELMRCKIRQNLLMSFAYNLFGIAFASGIFVILQQLFGSSSGSGGGGNGGVLDFLAGINMHINPAICAVLMSISSLAVIINSLLMFLKARKI